MQSAVSSVARINRMVSMMEVIIGPTIRSPILAESRLGPTYGAQTADKKISMIVSCPLPAKVAFVRAISAAVRSKKGMANKGVIRREPTLSDVLGGNPD